MGMCGVGALFPSHFFLLDTVSGNLELPPLHVSPLRLGMEPALTSPQKYQKNSRYTMATPVDTPTKPGHQEKTKTSILSRVTSRPALRPRFSSAELTIASSRQAISRSPEKELPPVRPTITLPMTARSDFGNDKGFFSAPRSAPSPPYAPAVTPTASSQKSTPENRTPTKQRRQGLVGLEAATMSHTTLAMRTSSLDEDCKPNNSQGRYQAQQTSPLRSDAVTPTREGLCTVPENRSVRRFSTQQEVTREDNNVARPRPGLVRIGREKVTLSVADVLQSELGVDVGDYSDDSSVYDDSMENVAAPASGKNRRILSKITTAPERLTSKSMPRLPDPDDIASPASSSSNTYWPNVTGNGESHQKTTMQSAKNRHNANFELEADSPLTALEENYRDLRECNSAKNLQQDRNTPFRREEYHTPTKVRPKTAGPSPHSNETQRYNHIEESQEIQNLRSALDRQCARFDELTGSLLEIIQRHQNEKVRYETRIQELEKELKKQAREAESLRRLLDARAGYKRTSGSSHSSDDGRKGCPPVQAASRKDTTNSSIPCSDTVQLTSLLEATRGKTLRRSKTLPTIHPSASENILSWPTPPERSPSPDSGAFNLEFPLPEPLSLPSISSTMLSSSLNSGSNGNVPALTAAPTAASGLSLRTEDSRRELAVCGGATQPLRSPTKANQNRMTYALVKPKSGYRSSVVFDMSKEAVSSIAYANNLNKGVAPSITRLLEGDDEVDLETLFHKLQASSENLLNY